MGAAIHSGVRESGWQKRKWFRQMAKRRNRPSPRWTQEGLTNYYIGNDACNNHFSAFLKTATSSKRATCTGQTAILYQTRKRQTVYGNSYYLAYRFVFFHFPTQYSAFFHQTRLRQKGRNSYRLKKMRTQLIHSICPMARPMNGSPV